MCKLFFFALLFVLSACATNENFRVYGPWYEHEELVTCKLRDGKLGRKQALVSSRVYTVALADGTVKRFRQFHILRDMSECGAR